MSLNYEDLDIEVIKMTFNRKDGGASDTIYIGDDYYQADGLYSGSPVVYPLLASRPIAQRAIGLNMGIKFDVALEVYSETTFKVYGQNFLDYLSDYDTHGAAVEIRYYSKSFSGTTTHSDSVNIRQTLETTTAINQDGVMTFQCADKWFEDKKIGVRITEEDFSNVYAGDNGRYGPIPFGNNVIIEAAALDSAADNTTDFIAGWSTTGHDINAVNQVYLRNTSTSFSDLAFLAISTSSGDFLDTKGTVVGETATIPTGYTADSLQDNHRGLPIDRSDNIAIMSARLGMSRNGTIAEGDGKLSCRIVAIEQNTQWDEVGAVLSEEAIDAVTHGTSMSNAWVDFTTPVLLPGGHKYMVNWVWTSDSSTAYPEAYIKTSVGDVDYYKPVVTNGLGSAWVGAADEKLNASVHALLAFTPSHQTVNGKRYLLQTLADNSGHGLGDSLLNVPVRLDVNGLEDDSSGTYTGVANQVMERASWVIEFLLRDDDLGIGHSASKIDTTAFDGAAVEQGILGLGVSFAIYEPRLLSELIADLCFQSRSVFYKTRDGKLALKTPIWDFTVPDYTIKEDALQNDFAFISTEDKSHDTIINEVVIGYNEDRLQNQDDALVVRKTGASRFKSVYYLESDDSSDGDLHRQDVAFASQGRYGVRPFNVDLTHYDTEAKAKKVASYYFDRYHELQKRVKFRVLRKDYNAVDLFDTIKVKSYELATLAGSSEKALLSDDGSPVYVYDDGVPVLVTRLGGVQGEVVEIAEYGPYMELTIETVSLY